MTAIPRAPVPATPESSSWLRRALSQRTHDPVAAATAVRTQRHVIPYAMYKKELSYMNQLKLYVVNELISAQHPRQLVN